MPKHFICCEVEQSTHFFSVFSVKQNISINLFCRVSSKLFVIAAGL